MKLKMLQRNTLFFGTMLLYLFMTAVIDYYNVSYLLREFVGATDYGLEFILVMMFFGVPAFLVGFFLFILLDWGLKKLWKERALLGLFAIGFALTVPFISATFSPWIVNIIIPIASSARNRQAPKAG